MELSERVRTFMESRGLTQRKLGDIIGVSDVTIGNYINGVNRPKYEFWKGIAVHFPEIDLVWFLTGKGKMEK